MVLYDDVTHYAVHRLGRRRRLPAVAHLPAKQRWIASLQLARILIRGS